MIVQIPKELRKLQEPWFSEGEVPPEFESYIRKGATIGKDHRGKKKITCYRTGRGGTIDARIIDNKTYKQLKKIIDRENFPDTFFTRRGASKERKMLEEFLSKRGISLGVEGETTPAGVFELTRKIYEILPAHHFGHKHFRALKIGGWGKEREAAGSEYKDPVVHMYKMAVKGPVRNYAALLLHETGHTHWTNLYDSNPQLSEGIMLSHGMKKELFGVDFLEGEKKREFYSLQNGPDEFASEFYLIYVTQGEKFQEFLAQSPESQNAWNIIYTLFKKSFRGVEYR